MIGRTHGVHAEPMTFGLKLALWYAELERDVERVRRARDGDQRRQDLGRGRHVRASAAGDRSRRLPAARARAGAGGVAGDSARSARGAAGGARDHRRVAREVRARDPRPAEDGDRRGRGAVRARARRARRRCRTSATRSAASRSSAWRGCCAATATRRSRTSRSGTSATSRTRRSSASSCPTASSRSITCCAASRASSAGMVVYPERMRENLEPLARRRVLRAPCCWSWRGRACRASRRTSGCSATRCARSPSSATSRRCCWPTPTCTRVLPPAEIERAFDLDEQLRHVDRRFSNGSSTSVPAGRRGVSACARVCSSRSSRRCSIRRARRLPTRCIRSATAASRTCGRASTSSSISRRPRPRRRGRWRPKWPTSCSPTR